MQLINVESLSGHEQPMATVLKEWLEKRDWVVALQEVQPQKGTVNGKVRYNLYARRAVITAKGGPRVLFNSHIDTVFGMRRVWLACRMSWTRLDVAGQWVRLCGDLRVSERVRPKSTTNNQPAFAVGHLRNLDTLIQGSSLMYLQGGFSYSALMLSPGTSVSEWMWVCLSGCGGGAHACAGSTVFRRRAMQHGRRDGDQGARSLRHKGRAGSSASSFVESFLAFGGNLQA